MASTNSHSSVLIVGAGVFGTSTAYHLSQSHPSPSSITVLDRTATPPRPAASTDINKIVRTDYTSPFYMELAYEAMKAWSTEPWAKRPDGERFFHNTGWVVLDEEGNDLAERNRKNFRERGKDPTSDVSLHEVKERWGGVLRETQLKGMQSAYWNPEAGWADAGDAVAAMMRETVKKGVQYACGDVQRLLLDENGVCGVRTVDGKIYTAEKIVLATGAWTSQLLTEVEDDLSIEDEDRVEKQVKAAGVCVAHYKMDDDEMKTLSRMPIIVYGTNGEVIPAPTQNRLLKFTNANSFTNTITTPHGRKISVPPERDQTIVPDKLKKETMEIILSKVMPRYTNRPAEYWRLCWDSISPSQNQLMTKHPHPRLANLFLAVGGSFHSWKFLPIIGKYMVNVLNGVSNGEEKDAAWAWKTGEETGRGAHEKVIPKRELRDLEDHTKRLLGSKL